MTILSEFLNNKSKEIYEQNKSVGWWDDPNRCIWTTIQLISTEVAEATEGERKDLMDDHLPYRKMGEVELADALIRALDLGGRMELQVYKDDLQPLKWHDNPGSIHLSLNKLIVQFADNVSEDLPYKSFRNYYCHIAYSRLIRGLLEAADLLNYDIIPAMQEKLEYNKNRADHKRENRNKEGGKKF